MRVPAGLGVVVVLGTLKSCWVKIRLYIFFLSWVTLWYLRGIIRSTLKRIAGLNRDESEYYSSEALDIDLGQEPPTDRPLYVCAEMLTKSKSHRTGKSGTNDRHIPNNYL